MHALVKSKIKAAFSALVDTITLSQNEKPMSAYAKAERIGPQRVILKIALNDNFRGLAIDRVAVATQQLQFGAPILSNENISVCMVAVPDLECDLTQAALEHRVTLKVRPEASQLTLTFRDNNSEIYSTQKISIE